ncbi:MAG: preprotein translocase subunit SecG [Puniceicoccales bacterium]
MSAIIFGLLSVALILVSGFVVLIILMQRASANSGMGASLGGGAAESALGAGAGNVLTKGTIWGSAAFFLLSFSLYLGFLAQAEDKGPGNIMPTEITTPEDAAAQSPEADEPLVKLPESMDFTAIAKEQQNAETQVVEGGQGTMTLTQGGEGVADEEAATEEPAAATEDASADSGDKSETNAQ